MSCFDFIIRRKSRKKSLPQRCREEEEEEEEEEEATVNEQRSSVNVAVAYDNVADAEDMRVREQIEKVASVVAWNPSAELFFMEIMQGNKDFDFMYPRNAYYDYYRRRVQVLRLRPRPRPLYW